MKPAKLHMKNIGPYLDEKIDFSKLDNMFLIKGDTGAGKTFIFDAVTFALYGALRGNRKDHEKDLKSRYAADEDESFVEFEFEAGGKRYFVYRTVQFEYKNRNGKISSKPKEVYFAEITGGGRKEFFGKPSEIDAKIQSVIGLDVDEFAQIILLPQGKFAEFLHKNSKERAETLKTLFPVDFYTGLTERVKEKFDKASFSLNLLESQILSLENGRDFSKAEEKIKDSEDEISNLEKAEAENHRKLAENTAKKAELSHILKDSRDFEQNQRNLEALLAQKNYFDSLQAKIKKAEKSLELKEFVSAAENAEKNKNDAQKNLLNAEQEKNSSQKEFDGLDSQKDEMQKLSEKNKSDGQKLKVLENKIDGASELPSLIKTESELYINIEENKKNLDSIKSKIEQEKAKLGRKNALELSNALNENLKSLRENQNELKIESENCRKRGKILSEKTEAEKNLAEATEKSEKEKQKFERTKAATEELEKLNEAQNLKNKAFALSAFLKPNLPCPVCGSVSHPNPVSKPAGLLDYAGQIRMNKENLESIQTAFNSFQTEISGLKTKIESYENQLSEIKTERKTEEVESDLGRISAEIEKLENQQAEIQRTGKNISDFESQLESLKEKSSGLEENYLETKTRRKDLEKSLGESLESVIQKKNLLQAEFLKNSQKFDVWQKSHQNAETQKEKAKSKFEECVRNSADAKEKFDSAEKILRERIAGSVFATLEEAKNAFLETEEIESAREDYNNYQKKLKSLSDAVQNGKSKKLKSSSEIASELETCEKTESETNQKLSEIKNLLDAKKAENTKFKNDFEKLEKTKAERDELEKQTAPLSLLSADLSGKNPLKLKFETWALSMYFEQVVSFASKRFFEISGGRFSFELKDEKASGRAMSGLDLKVFDSHSGKYSDPAELSGGETFEASISLALALTDVVQNSSGGIQLDSLFIDEGFGTLDPETLEKAMSVLTELSETKMIGMISHVSEMEDFPDIKSVLKVNKTSRGSTVSVIV